MGIAKANVFVANRFLDMAIRTDTWRQPNIFGLSIKIAAHAHVLADPGVFANPAAQSNNRIPHSCVSLWGCSGVRKQLLFGLVKTIFSVKNSTARAVTSVNSRKAKLIVKGF
jgi:hypothetical protein